MLPLSAVVICRNEERYIERCLTSLTWVDELLVVDALSTDKTPEICRDPTKPWAGKIRFIQREWPGFRNQRNFALQTAKHDWILVVDADEACSPELQSRIQSLLALPGGPPCKYYKIRRQEYFLGERVNYGIWNPSYQDRFFYKPGLEYINDVHEYPPYPTTPERIHEPLHHAPDFAFEKFLEKMNFYTTIEAKAFVTRGRRTNAFRLITAFPAMFLKNYFYYKAYRDGFVGFVISIMEGLSRAVRHIKIWQYSRLVRDEIRRA